MPVRTMVEPKQDTIDGYLIAHQELEEKNSIYHQRPLPFGGCEYWKVSDLEIIRIYHKFYYMLHHYDK